jgi:hypothetical protein
MELKDDGLKDTTLAGFRNPRLPHRTDIISFNIIKSLNFAKRNILMRHSRNLLVTWFFCERACWDRGGGGTADVPRRHRSSHCRFIQIYRDGAESAPVSHGIMLLLSKCLGILPNRIHQCVNPHIPVTTYRTTR